MEVEVRVVLQDAPAALEKFSQVSQGNLAYLRDMIGFQWNRKALLGGIEVTLLQLVAQWAARDQSVLSGMEQLAETLAQSTA